MPSLPGRCRAFVARSSAHAAMSGGWRQCEKSAGTGETESFAELYARPPWYACLPCHGSRGTREEAARTRGRASRRRSLSLYADDEEAVPCCACGAAPPLRAPSFHPLLSQATSYILPEDLIATVPPPLLPRPPFVARPPLPERPPASHAMPPRPRPAPSHPSLPLPASTMLHAHGPPYRK